MIRPVAADGRIETGGAFTPILRSRVVERISSAAMQRIVLIIAPAGYGKSLALHQYLARLEDSHVRYDVRAEHASLLGFVRGLADALLEVAPDARKTVSGAYEKSRSSKTPGADLAMWMHAHIKAFTGVIAIDDLHIAENDPEISKFIVSLIERTKGRARWIIASRSSLDLPVGSWLAYGDMDLNIDEQDLRFTLEEARQAAKSTRVGIRDEELSSILQMTEGWPTALSFALRSSTRSIDLRNIAANTREMVYRYLAEQVYRSLDNEERELLNFIAFLPEIDVDVLRRAGYAKAKAMIESLRDRVAFVYPDRPNVYRCHDLFRDFLQHEVELEGDAAVEAMQRRVAQALEEAEHLPYALQLYARIPSEADILRLLGTCGFQLMEQAHEDAVNLAVEALSSETRATDPLVLGLRGMREAHAGRFDRAESLLERAIARSSDRVLSGELASRLAFVLFNQGRDVISLLEPFAGDEGLPNTVRAKALSFLVPAYAHAGRRELAYSAMSKADEFAGTIDSDELRAKIFQRMGIAALSLVLPGEQVSALFTRAQTLASENALYITSAAAFGGLSTVALFYEDDVTKAVWYAQQAMNAALKAGDRFSLQNSLLQLISVETRRGNVERVIALEQQFAVATTTDASRSFYIIPARAMSAAWEGRFDEAYRLLSTVADRSFYNFDRVFNSAMQGIYAVAIGKRERAIELVSATLNEINDSEFAYLHGWLTSEIARVLCGVVEALAGRVTNAQRIHARKSPTDNPTVEAVRHCAVAICRLVKSPALRDEVAESLEQLRAVGHGGISMVLEQAVAAVVGQQPDSESPLTRAEIDVLYALSQGRSPKEIAQETGRSVYTIQAHVQNVIRKLGCSGRSEALTVARKKGLLKFN
jgi:DNA-binding CsgD family transcriptional regulator